jgi:oligopeptide/dipeptide ABC transporter ATP-binding protein
MSILEIEDAVIHFRVSHWLSSFLSGKPAKVEVIAGVSLDLPAGQTLGLVGESGSGKTTLGRAVVGLVPLTSGRIRVDGATAEGWGDGPWRFIRRDAALIFQDPIAALNPRMTIANLVTEPLVIHSPAGLDRRRRAAELLDTVGLPSSFLDRFPHELSGGQARRIAVARALALKPKLVVADEPTAGLDVSVQGDLLNLLTGLQRDFGLSYLIITHNLAVARHVTDRLAIIYLGRLVEIGPTAAIYRRPAHPYTRALLAAQPSGDPTRRSAPPLPGDVPSLWSRPTGCEFHTRCPMAQDICRRVAPPSVEIGPGHRAECHFAEAAATVPA